MKSILSMTALAFAITLAPQAFAHEGHDHPMNPEMKAVHDACKKDMDTLCNGKKGREMHECFMSNQDKVQDQGCKDAMAKLEASMKARHDAAMAACPEMAKACDGKTGHDMGKCMHEYMHDHHKDLKPECKKAMRAMMPMRGHHGPKGEGKEANAKPAGDAPADKPAESK
jgi:hypothetical protein